jgi:hypothetical protein
MRDFLNDFAYDEKKKLTAGVLDELAGRFKLSIEIINLAKGKSAFRPIRALNAAVFEAVIVGISERVRVDKSSPSVDKVRTEYDKLLLNTDFLSASNSATATEESVKTRQRLAVEAFAST